MSAAERRKGASGELEVVHLLNGMGWPLARRSSDGRPQVSRGDIAFGPPNVHLEVRRRETVSIIAWWEHADSEAHPLWTPVVAFRRNRTPWLACLELEELLPLLLLRERG